MHHLTDTLTTDIKTLGLTPTSTLITKSLDYLALLSKWNKTYNLTAITTPEDMLTHHLLDSLSIAPYLEGKHIIDVGSGAGLPGIPLALYYPDKQFTLLDSNGKKTRFLLHAVHTLGINNAEVVQARVTDYQPPQCFDIIVSRAFSALVNMLQTTKHLACPDGKIFAMKGRYPEAELAAINQAFTLLATHRLQIPRLAAERYLLCFGAQKAHD